MQHRSMPDFLIIGAPKAGTTALHAALTQHPEVFVSNPKEPKYWLCDDAPPPAWNGPGDRHSQQEWIWRRGEYEALFERRRGRAGARREHAVLPVDPRRPPADRRAPARREADRRRPRPDRPRLQQLDAPVVATGSSRSPTSRRTFALQQERIDAGLGAVLAVRRPRPVRRAARAPLPVRRPRSGCSSCATAPSSTIPRAAVDRACRFLGITQGLIGSIPRDNSRDFVEPGWRPRLLGPVVRTGARLGPVRAAAGVAQGERAAGRPAQRRPARPPAAPQRRRPVSGCSPTFAEDIGLLSKLTGEDFGDWLSTNSRGSFLQRARAAAARERQQQSRAGKSPNQRDQVVRAVGARGLDVEPGPPVGQRHRRGVAPGAVGVRGRRSGRARRPPVGSRPSARCRWSRTSSTRRRRDRRTAP